MSETTKVEKQYFEVPLSFTTRWETTYTRGKKRDLTFLKGSRTTTVQRSWRLVILSRSPFLQWISTWAVIQWVNSALSVLTEEEEYECFHNSKELTAKGVEWSNLNLIASNFGVWKNSAAARLQASVWWYTYVYPERKDGKAEPTTPIALAWISVQTERRANLLKATLNV